MTKFEIISSYKDKNINLPKRKTKLSAGYDFEVAEDILVPTIYDLAAQIDTVINYDEDEINSLTLKEMTALTKEASAKLTLVPTGIKCYLEPNQYLELVMRSSVPLKNWLFLGNGVGIIDADYVNNPDNEGHIYFQILNLGPYPIQLKKGDTIGQGIIHTYSKIDDDKTEGERLGGFGSTNG